MVQLDAGQKTDIRPARRPWFWFLCLLAGVAIGLGVSKLRERFVTRVNLEVAGADVSKAGGVAIFVSGTDGYLRQVCNGVCDNIDYKFKSRHDEYTLKVDDAQGKCIACPSTYVLDYSDEHQVLGGAPKLELKPGARF